MKAVMTVKNYDTTIVIEKDHSDLTMSEWLEMFSTAMIGISFPKSVVAEGMAYFAEELLKETNKTQCD
jgi:DNA-binding ferritin-like protein (Dps family)